MAVMMIMMVVLIATSPGHIGTQGGHESPAQAPPAQQSPSAVEPVKRR